MNYAREAQMTSFQPKRQPGQEPEETSICMDAGVVNKDPGLVSCFEGMVVRMFVRAR